MRATYKTLAIVLIAVLAAILNSPVRAQPSGPAAFYLRTDRASYLPGDSGTLLITIRNQGTQAFTVKNLTISFSWLSFLNDHWDGNYTINSINKAISTGQTYNTQQGFTVPSDGRATIPLGGSASVTVMAGTDIGGGGGRYETGDAAIGIAAATYQPLGFSSSILQIVTIALLAVIAVVMTLVLFGIRRMPKK